MNTKSHGFGKTKNFFVAFLYRYLSYIKSHKRFNESIRKNTQMKKLMFCFVALFCCSCFVPALAVEDNGIAPCGTVSFPNDMLYYTLSRLVGSRIMRKLVCSLSVKEV